MLSAKRAIIGFLRGFQKKVLINHSRERNPSSLSIFSFGLPCHPSAMPCRIGVSNRLPIATPSQISLFVNANKIKPINAMVKVYFFMSVSSISFVLGSPFYGLNRICQQLNYYFFSFKSTGYFVSITYYCFKLRVQFVEANLFKVCVFNSIEAVYINTLLYVSKLKYSTAL